MREAKSQLRDLLESNEQVQSRILGAIRERIAEYYQYTRSSVPFEDLQNADDAAVELNNYFAPSESDSRCSQTFHVVSDENQVTFAHYGRRINQYPIDADDWAPFGFDNDLWKMLVLSLSNKLHNSGASTHSVTGKFGLGFKEFAYLCRRATANSERSASL